MKILAIFMAVTLFLSGCFEIREEVNMKADGSGEVSFVVNLSQSKDNVAKYMAMGSVEGYKVPKKEEVEASLAKIKSMMGAVPGMSAVMTKSDWSNYIFTVSGRFAHVEALNKAMELVAKEYDKGGQARRFRQVGFWVQQRPVQAVFELPVQGQGVWGTAVHAALRAGIGDDNQHLPLRPEHSKSGPPEGAGIAQR
ncbi:MAG: hypothetical protein IPM82_16655 [Saprospiraceae bacterium]|nr:hypothetical protein [Saprospiraceae bacterium]